MKLCEYIQSKGLPLEENIFLLSNSRFPGEIPNCIDWPATESQSPVARLKRKTLSILSSEESYVFNLPKETSPIFFGRTNRSMDSICGLKALFRLISRETKNRYTILCGKGDYNFSNHLLRLVPKNVSKIFLNNLDVKDERLMYFPMGRDFRACHLFEEFKPKDDRSQLLYCNFSTNTHPVRERIYQLIKSKDYITFDHMGNFLEYSLSREEFYGKLSSSKFAICPRGNAIDTFRMWDCLYLGVIPIVIREAVFHEDLLDLPILFLDSISDFYSLTPEYLEKKFSEMLTQEWNYEKLKLSFWMSKIGTTMC